MLAGGARLEQAGEVLEVGEVAITAGGCEEPSHDAALGSDAREELDGTMPVEGRRPPMKLLLQIAESAFVGVIEIAGRPVEEPRHGGRPGARGIGGACERAQEPAPLRGCGRVEDAVAACDDCRYAVAEQCILYRRHVRARPDEHRNVARTHAARRLRVAGVGQHRVVQEVAHLPREIAGDRVARVGGGDLPGLVPR